MTHREPWEIDRTAILRDRSLRSRARHLRAPTLPPECERTYQSDRSLILIRFRSASFVDNAAVSQDRRARIVANSSAIRSRAIRRCANLADIRNFQSR